MTEQIALDVQTMRAKAVVRVVELTEHNRPAVAAWLNSVLPSNTGHAWIGRIETATGFEVVIWWATDADWLHAAAPGDFIVVSEDGLPCRCTREQLDAVYELVPTNEDTHA